MIFHMTLWHVQVIKIAHLIVGSHWMCAKVSETHIDRRQVVVNVQFEDRIPARICSLEWWLWRTEAGVWAILRFTESGFGDQSLG